MESQDTPNNPNDLEKEQSGMNHAYHGAAEIKTCGTGINTDIRRDQIEEQAWKLIVSQGVK
jgi:hypothetical protein